MMLLKANNNKNKERSNKNKKYVNLISAKINKTATRTATATSTSTILATTHAATATAARAIQTTNLLIAAAPVHDAATAAAAAAATAQATTAKASKGRRSISRRRQPTSNNRNSSHNNNKYDAAPWSLNRTATCLQTTTFLWMLLLQLLLSIALPTTLGAGVDSTNGNLTDLGSPAFVFAANQQLIPNDSQQFYELVNQVTIKEVEHSSKHETSYIFRCQLKINSVWHSENEQLLQVFITEPTVNATGKSSDKLVQQHITKIPDRPFYISLIDGQPSKVIAHTSRDQSLLNLERGVASLLQLSSNNGPTKELDVSGHCNAFYNVKSSTRIEKIKTDCTHWDLRVNYRGEKPLGITQESREHVNYHLSAEGSLLQARSVENHKFALTAKPDFGSSVDTEFTLHHLEVGNEIPEQLKFKTLDETIKSLLDWYRVFDIESDVDGALSELKHTTLAEQISNVKDELTDEHVGRETLAVAMAELLPYARISKENEFVDVLTKHKDLQNQLVDLLGAVQTVDAHNAINKVFSYYEKNDAELLEKYLQSLAVGTHPDRDIIEHLFGLLKNKEQPIKHEKLLDTVLQTVSSLARQSGFDANDALLREVREFILAALSSDCEKVDIECQTLYLRALMNLQDPTTLPTLLSFALSSDAKISFTAMQALKALPIVYFKETERKVFTDIFYQRQRKYDSSARTFALDILLALKPSKAELGQLLDYLMSNDRQFEVKTFVIQKLRMLSEKCPRFRALLNDCLRERPGVNNYNILAQKGLTTVLTRQISQAPGFNETLLSVQEIYQGVLKRGSVEMLLNAGRDETSTFKLGIYTSGLSSFVGDSNDDASAVADDEEPDDSPSTAGMEISVQGVLFRPLVFFSGQTELMGHVWSGTASESTPAYQATTLAHDHEQYVILSSGATVYFRLIGMKSIDLNGKVEFSLWNRNANTEILQDAGAGIVGYTVAGFTYAKVEHQFTLAYEPKISLQANLDFYSEVKLCMQLQRPDMVLTHMNTRTVYLNAGHPYTKNIHSKITHKSPGGTLALNQKNNEMCNIIFPEHF